MKSISSFNIEERFKQKTCAPHTLAALVDEVVKVVGINKTYNYAYWLRKVKDFQKKGGSVGQILDWLKEIRDYPADFNKGGTLTNKLTKYGRKQVSQNEG